MPELPEGHISTSAVRTLRYRCVTLARLAQAKERNGGGEIGADDRRKMSIINQVLFEAVRTLSA